MLPVEISLTELLVHLSSPYLSELEKVFCLSNKSQNLISCSVPKSRNFQAKNVFLVTKELILSLDDFCSRRGRETAFSLYS